MRPDVRDREDRAARVLIGAVVRRRWWRQLAFAVLAAMIVVSSISIVSSAGGLTGLTTATRVALGLLSGAGAVAWAHRFRSRRAAAAAIEHVRPSCRNLVITAEELERHPERASEAMRIRVSAEASEAVRGLSPGAVVPLRITVVALMASAGVAVLSTPAARESLRDAADRLSSVLPTRAGPASVRVTIEPPAYTGRSVAVLVDPQRIEVLETSRISFELPPGWRVRFGDQPLADAHVARTNGYFAVESPSADRATRLVSLHVLADRVPAVRISSPGKDLLLPDGSRTIPVDITATDDLALQNLELRYTKVSGSGEQFEFTEGVLPVRIVRRSVRDWTADGHLALAALRLDPGDSIVYRAVARDARPGDAGFASSDTYFVEIAGPGQVALEGVDMPPDMERYAMSQQMIVLKLERLHAREESMTRSALTEEAASLAAEQRTVRANFIFLLGGHVEDEEEEAAQSHEIQEGRLENTARQDINLAISQMSRAEQGMTAVDLAAALPPARAAVQSLQRAFGRSRYLLRALPSRTRPDPSRRLTADVSDAENWRRVPEEAERREGEPVRNLLSALIDALPTEAGKKPDRTRLEQLAESALAIDPSSTLWQEVARALLEAQDASALRQAIARVSREAMRGIVPRTPLSTRPSPLERAFRMEGRR